MEHEALSRLWDLEDWPRLEAKSREYLERDPLDPFAQKALARALFEQQRVDEVVPILHNLAAHYAFNAEVFHEVSVSYWLTKKNPKFAWHHAYELLQVDPEDSDYWHKAAVVLMHLHDFTEAQGAIMRARALNPTCEDCAELEAYLCAIHTRSAEDYASLKQALRSGLELNPNSANLHELSGDFSAIAEANHAQALEHYRAALARNPMDVDCQKKLTELIPVSSIWARALFLPILALRYVGQRIERQPAWTILLMFVAIKLTLAFLAWLIFELVLFYIPSVFYHWFFVADISVRSIQRRPIRWLMTQIQRVSFVVRVCGFFLAWAGIIVVPAWYIGVDPKITLGVIGGTYLLNLCVVLIWLGVQRLDLWMAERLHTLSFGRQLIAMFTAGAGLNLIVIAAMAAGWAVLAGFQIGGGVGFFLFIVMIIILLVINIVLVSKTANAIRRRNFEYKIRNLVLPEPGPAPPVA